MDRELERRRERIMRTREERREQKIKSIKKK